MELLANAACLSVLDLSNNGISEVPDTISLLQALKTLDLSNNDLSGGERRLYQLPEGRSTSFLPLPHVCRAACHFRVHRVADAHRIRGQSHADHSTLLDKRRRCTPQEIPSLPDNARARGAGAAGDASGGDERRRRWRGRRYCFRYSSCRNSEICFPRCEWLVMRAGAYLVSIDASFVSSQAMSSKEFILRGFRVAELPSDAFLGESQSCVFHSPAVRLSRGTPWPMHACNVSCIDAENAQLLRLHDLGLITVPASLGLLRNLQVRTAALLFNGGDEALYAR